ncbi:MAG: hypothetical protein QG656_23 [Candidatus Hydrogenedentes bacterium]|nr:hypothetical protein [Candidatus Hydrogenedentota bacterium]
MVLSRGSLFIVFLFMACCMAGAYAAPQPLTASIEKDCVEVTIDGKLFTRYKFAGEPSTYGDGTVDGKPFSTYKLEPEPKYPYFYPVIGPLSGKSVTTELSEPYPHHHSLLFGCDRVNGGNYWQDLNARGRIVSQGPKLVEASGARVVIADECLWQQLGKDPIIRDTRTIEITAPSETMRVIDFAITLEALVDIQIEQTNHSLFSARMTPELSVLSGGTITNAEGKTNPEGTHGVISKWCDYSGAWKDGPAEGLAIFQHPANRWYPCQYFTRDYGFMSPTPMQWLEGGRFDLPKGEKLPLQYRVVVHSGNVQEAGIADLFNQYETAAAALK